MLSLEKVEQIERLIASKKPYREIAALLNVSCRTVVRIKKGVWKKRKTTKTNQTVVPYKCKNCGYRVIYDPCKICMVIER